MKRTDLDQWAVRFFAALCITVYAVVLGCDSIPTTLVAAATTREVRIYRAAEQAAILANVQVAVNFVTDGPWIASEQAAGWVNCPQEKPPWVVNFNAKWLNGGGEDRVEYMVAVAYHEICHVYYREMMKPCMSADEWRASACGTNLQTCGKVSC